MGATVVHVLPKSAADAVPCGAAIKIINTATNVRAALITLVLRLVTLVGRPRFDERPHVRAYRSRGIEAGCGFDGVCRTIEAESDPGSQRGLRGSYVAGPAPSSTPRKGRTLALGNRGGGNWGRKSLLRLGAGNGIWRPT